MCIITNENDIVVSVSLIPGVNPIPSTFNIYFPVRDGIPRIGDVYKPNSDDK